MVQIEFVREAAAKGQVRERRRRWAPLFGLLLIVGATGPVEAESAGSVPATVTVEQAASCILVSGTYEFDTQRFADGVPDRHRSRTTADISNCGTSNQDILVRGTSAVGNGAPAASWELDPAASVACQIDRFGVDVSTAGSPAVPVSTVDRTFVSAAMPETALSTGADLYMPCSGSSGGGETMTFSVIYTAVAIEAPTAALNVELAGAGSGSVTSDPAGIDCGSICLASYPVGSVISLIAAPQPGSNFAGWSGGGCTGTGPCVLALSSATTVTATFSTEVVSLTVLKTGPLLGDVNSSPVGIACGPVCSALFPAGTTVALTVTSPPDVVFVGWSGGGCAGSLPACSVTLASATTVTANFDVRSVPLSVVINGSGSGVVTSSPPGISCGPLCSTSFEFGTTVTLTATPQQGSTFAGWSGGNCSGTATCTVSMSAAWVITATFTSIPAAP